MTLDCKWSGRKASAKCVQTTPEAYISRIYLLALKLEANCEFGNHVTVKAGTTPANNKKTNFPPVSRLCLLFGEIQSSITDLSISGSVWQPPLRDCKAMLSPFSCNEPSINGRFWVFVESSIIQIRIETWANCIIKTAERNNLQSNVNYWKE